MVGNQNAFVAVQVDGSVVTYHCARKHPVDAPAPKKTKVPISPDSVQPGPAMPYRERRTPKERRQDVSKRPPPEIRGRRMQRKQE